MKGEWIKLAAAIVLLAVGLTLALTGVVTPGTPNGVFATIPMSFGGIMALAIGLRLYRLRRKRRRAQTPTEGS